MKEDIKVVIMLKTALKNASPFKNDSSLKMRYLFYSLLFYCDAMKDLKFFNEF